MATVAARRAVLDGTPAELAVARLDQYSAEEHAAAISAARDRAAKRQDARAERARAAEERLRNAR